MGDRNLDRGLDEIIAEGRSTGSRNRRPRRQDRQDQPRDGVRKSFRNEPRSIDSEWVHDRFENFNPRRSPVPRRRRDSPERDSRGAKLRVENIHYDLTEDDLEELFNRIGPVTKLQLRYDRAGRSDGVAFVTYESKRDADEAIRQFDGANANGQPIRLTAVPSGPSRNPFDSAVMPGRPLAERITNPDGRSRSLSPSRNYDVGDAARKGIDRYVPGRDGRSRSPAQRRRVGRRPGARRDDSSRDQNGGGRGVRGNARQKKTQEELDAEMADYFGGGDQAAGGQKNASKANAAALTEDIDMIE